MLAARYEPNQWWHTEQVPFKERASSSCSPALPTPAAGLPLAGPPRQAQGQGLLALRLPRSRRRAAEAWAQEAAEGRGTLPWNTGRLQPCNCGVLPRHALPRGAASSPGVGSGGKERGVRTEALQARAIAAGGGAEASERGCGGGALGGCGAASLNVWRPGGAPPALQQRPAARPRRTAPAGSA